MLEEALYTKIHRLNQKVWEGRVNRLNIQMWLDNFDGTVKPIDAERKHMLFLLSNFMYFGSLQIRELLKAVFRDLYKYPIVHAIRKDNRDTRNLALIDGLFSGELSKSRFLGVGNPSESGCHLLYHFRQMNALPKEIFIHAHEIFRPKRFTGRWVLANKAIRRYVFIDDFCGSGDQVVGYCKQIIQQAKKQDPRVKFFYYSLFGCKKGVENVARRKLFDDVQCLVELDETFGCFHGMSRYFHAAPTEIDKGIAERICRKYGSRMMPGNPLGYGDCQLLLSFHHNTPDNTLPVFWWDEVSPDWTPIFKRYPKLSYTSI